MGPTRGQQFWQHMGFTSRADVIAVLVICVLGGGSIAGLVVCSVALQRNVAGQHIARCEASNTTWQVCVCGDAEVLCSQVGANLTLVLRGRAYSVYFSSRTGLVASSGGGAAAKACLGAPTRLPNSAISCYYDDHDILGSLEPYDGGGIEPSFGLVLGVVFLGVACLAFVLAPLAICFFQCILYCTRGPPEESRGVRSGGRVGA